MDSSATAGGIIVNARGEIVLAPRRDTAWELPHGRVAPGETPLAAALRDAEAETGLTDIHYQGALPVYEVTDPLGDRQALAVYPFLFTTVSASPLSAGHSEWVTVDRAVELLADGT